MVSREIEFAIGGFCLLIGLIPLELAILVSVPMLNLGLLVSFGGMGVFLGLLGFYLIGIALFSNK